MRPAFSGALCLFAPILRQRSEAADEMLAVAVGIGCEVPIQNGQNEYRRKLGMLIGHNLWVNHSSRVHRVFFNMNMKYRARLKDGLQVS